MFNISEAGALKTNYSDPHTHEIMTKIIGPKVEREKAEYLQRQRRWARENYAAGPQQQESMGQKVGTVDLITYLRWEQEVPGCWKDPGFVKMFMTANEECACPTRSF